jgi:6-phosphogluconolactonase
MVRVFDGVDALSAAAARDIASAMTAAVRTRRRCAMALSGGDTPITLYRLLAADYQAQIPWPQVHVFWTDERYVPWDDLRSNYRMARETLLEHVACPPTNIHPIQTHFVDATAAASEYEAILRAFFPEGVARFDVSILGLGPDAHTASLFPGSAALDARTQWVASVLAPADPPERVTLTPPALTSAIHSHVLVAGARKADALRHALSSDDVHRFPAACLRRATGAVTWWTDRAAHGAR